MRNAQATRIAEVLGGLLTGQANAAPGANGGAAGASGPAGGAQGGARPQNTASNPGGQMGQGMSGSSKGGLPCRIRQAAPPSRQTRRPTR
ncbi:hypothetical protein G6F45_014178 [Rhizopus arrhizus]|nr:hypothetical protein G6F45_014178 [Rhizopus arrhizus]